MEHLKLKEVPTVVTCAIKYCDISRYTFDPSFYRYYYFWLA